MRQRQRHRRRRQEKRSVAACAWGRAWCGRTGAPVAPRDSQQHANWSKITRSRRATTAARSLTARYAPSTVTASNLPPAPITLSLSLSLSSHSSSPLSIIFHASVSFRSVAQNNSGPSPVLTASIAAWESWNDYLIVSEHRDQLGCSISSSCFYRRNISLAAFGRVCVNYRSADCEITTGREQKSQRSRGVVTSANRCPEIGWDKEIYGNARNNICWGDLYRFFT